MAAPRAGCAPWRRCAAWRDDVRAGPRVAVVGGGVAGAATAYWLARGGAAVTVVDNGEPGQATSAGAGIVQPWSSSAEGRVYDLDAAGAAFYPTQLDALAESGVPDVGYAVTGSLVVHPEPAALDDIERRVRTRTRGVSAAGAVERLDGIAARALFPPLAPHLTGLLVSGGARVDGRRLRAGLITGAHRHGALLVRAEARLGPGPTGAPVLRAGPDHLATDAVVVAAGAWTDRLLRPLRCAVQVEPQRGQLTHLGLEGVDTSRWPSVLPPSGHYLVAFEGGRVVAGATRELGSGFDARVTAAGQREVLAEALAVAPDLAQATVLESRVGLRPLAAVPHLGAVPGRPGLFVNAGLGAAGLTMAPVVGHAVAQQVLTGRSDLDLRPFPP